MRISLFAIALLLAIQAEVLFAQQDIFARRDIVSPEIKEDRSVTFNLKAPEVTTVTVSGSWMKEPAAVPMQKINDSVWSYTTEALSPDLYRYSFTVDGVRAIDPSNSQTIRDVATISNVFIVGGEMADLFKVQNVPHGTVAYPWYDSPGNNKKRRLAVYTPPGYESSEDRYPVLYLLHGVGGDETAWLGSGRAAQILDNLIAAGKAEPMIVVMPNGNVAQQASPGLYKDGVTQASFNLPNTMDGSFEASFSDIMSFVHENYRTKESKEGSAIAGLSMGGYHTAYISLNYPDTFDYIGLFSAALNVNNDNRPDAPVYRDIDKKLEEQKENGIEVYWIAIGEDDFPFLYSGVQTFRKDLDRIEFPYVYKETGGGHTWDNWRRYLAEFLPMLFK